MVRDITIGQYYRVESPMHRLDPRVKLVGTLLFILTLFIFDEAVGMILAGICLMVVIGISRVPLRYVLRGLKPVFLLLAFTMVFNLFLTDGKPLVQLGFLSISREGVFSALRLGTRLVMLITGSSIMTLTTTPTQLTDGIERLLRPLGKVRVPVHELAMMMTIALRFIPILLEETDKIMKAQAARCADFESGNLVQRARSLVPILIPLFVAAFRRANDLAMAMEARCYRGGEGRTQMKPLHYRMRDVMAYGVMALYCVCDGLLCSYI